MNRFWAEYTTREISRLDRDTLVAVLPIGAIEQHGPHLPLKVDSFIADAIVSRVAARLPSTSRVLFLPTQSLGKSNEHLRYPGTLSLSAETLMAILRETGASVARAGIRKLVFLNAHGGNVSTLDIVARDLRVEHGMLVFAVNWFGFGAPDGIYEPDERRHGIHAGDMETSVMLALEPESVRRNEAANFRSSMRNWDADYDHIGLDRVARPAWQAQDLHPGGAAGDAAAATPEKGAATLDRAIDGLVALLAEIERAPLAWLETPPDTDDADL
ncbi:MAG: creatininase family protein [Paracoccaceae bacterium]|nr:creatininase family protein [Paracoccaceae bacterium]